MRREHEPRAGVRGAQHTAEAREQLLQPPAPALQRRRALVALQPRGLGDLRVDALEQRRAAVAADEQRQRRVQALAVEVRIEVVQAGREAAAHLPVRRGVLAARQRAPAVAQPEQRVELLDQLGRGRPPPHRADADRVAGGGLARDLEDRERDVQPAAQVDVAVGLALAAHVAGRAQRLDQPVLEQQGAELGLRDLVVDVLGVGGPRRAGA